MVPSPCKLRGIAKKPESGVCAPAERVGGGRGGGESREGVSELHRTHNEYILRAREEKTCEKQQSKASKNTRSSKSKKKKMAKILTSFILFLVIFSSSRKSDSKNVSEEEVAKNEEEDEGEEEEVFPPELVPGKYLLPERTQES